MSTTTEETGAVPVTRTIDVTDAGAELYEQMILAQVTAPASGIAAMEERRARDAHPSEREIRRLQLQMEAAQIEAAMAVVRKVSARYGLPPATIMREGATGMRLAAMKIAEAA